MKSIRMLASGFHVDPLLEQIDAHPNVWNTHRMRTEHYGTAHGAVSDIWVRYNDWANFTGDPQAFNGPHESVWYPVCDVLTAVKPLVESVMRAVGGGELGGVLITRIPPGGEVRPHQDHGWHAEHYEKFAVQLRSAPGQAFCFEDAWLSPMPGDLYTFINQRTHWVINPTERERMTLIVCIRRADG